MSNSVYPLCRQPILHIRVCDNSEVKYEMLFGVSYADSAGVGKPCCCTGINRIGFDDVFYLLETGLKHNSQAIKKMAL